MNIKMVKLPNWWKDLQLHRHLEVEVPMKLTITYIIVIDSNCIYCTVDTLISQYFSQVKLRQSRKGSVFNEGFWEMESKD